MNADSKVTEKPIFGELQLETALEEVTEIISDIVSGISFYYFCLSPATIALAKKSYDLLGPHPEKTENAVSADGLYFGIKKQEIGEPGSIYDTQIRSVLSSKKPDFQYTDNEITFKSQYGVPIHFKLLDESDPILNYLKYPEQLLYGQNDNVVFLPNPLKEYLEEIKNEQSKKTE